MGFDLRSGKLTDLETPNPIDNPCTDMGLSNEVLIKLPRPETIKLVLKSSIAKLIPRRMSYITVN